MTDEVPKLVPRPPGRAVQVLGLFSRGTRETSAQIKPYTAWWNEQNQLAVNASGPLMVVVGDSTAIGIGASGPDRGYAARVATSLRDDHDDPWRVINLALSGARIQDALDRQLPILSTLSPDLVVCCIGTNDLVWGRDTGRLRRRLVAMTRELPSGSLIATLAGRSARARMANATVRSQAEELGLISLNPWNEPGPGERLAPDRFHPNDLGYELMAKAFGRPLGLIPADDDSEGSSPPSTR